MNFFLEIKNRAIINSISLFFIIFQMYSYKHTLLFYVIKPNITSSHKTNFYFICTNVTEGFISYWQIVLNYWIQLFFIFTILHFFLFFLPGLYQSEKNLILYCFLVYFIFIFIFIFIYNRFVLPFSWSFFNNILDITANNDKLSQQKILHLFFEIKINEYLNFYFTLYYISLVFTHLLFIVSFKLNILYKNSSFKNIKNYRKKLYFLFFVFSTLITPPDIFSQIIIAFILIFLLELIIFFIIWFNKKIRFF